MQEEMEKSKPDAALVCTLTHLNTKGRGGGGRHKEGDARRGRGRQTGGSGNR